MEKVILCLSSSRKITARCVAGKDITDKSWIRPVSGTETHEIYDNHRRYVDGTLAQVLDVISIPFIKHLPHQHQPENFLINEKSRWSKQAILSIRQLDQFLDVGALPWPNGFSTYGKQNDRIPEAMLNGNFGSLKLIHTDNIVLEVGKKRLPSSGMLKTFVHAEFKYLDIEYVIDVTDIEIENEFKPKGIGKYKIGSGYICISLGELFNGYSYKLAATIIRDS